MSSERFNVPPEAAGDSNQPAGGDASGGGTSTKSKAVKRREQAKRAKARARAAALSAATTAAAKPTLSTFVGDDANLPVLDYTADIAIRYRHFKEEMSRHAGKTDPLMSTVIDEGSEVEAIAEIKKHIAAVEPTPKDPALTEPVEIAKDEARYDMELWEYKTRVGEQIKAVNKFKIECGKFYNVTIGQISQSVDAHIGCVLTDNPNLQPIQQMEIQTTNQHLEHTKRIILIWTINQNLQHSKQIMLFWTTILKLQYIVKTFF
jgi:hypothetical protein